MNGVPHEPKEPDRRDWVGFWSMIAQQTLGAFNDKAAQFILIPLGIAAGSMAESRAALLIALPFILFAPLAGGLADQFSKRNLLLGGAVAQSALLAWLTAAIATRNAPSALAALLALASLAVFLSPARIGINKELIGSKSLGFAASVQQMATMVAILSWQIIAGILYSHRQMDPEISTGSIWQPASALLWILTLVSVPAIALVWIIPRTPARSFVPLGAAGLFRHFQHLKELWRNTSICRASLAVAFFWGFATFINLWSVKMAKSLTGGQQGFVTLASWFMGATSVGMIAGFGTASFLLRRRIELGWVPVAGTAMTLVGLALALTDPQSALALIADAEGSGAASLMAACRSGFIVTLAGLAFFAALFLAPLNAWLQDHYPPDKRGRIQSAVNLQDCLAGILAAVSIEAMGRLTAIVGWEPITGLRAQIAVGGAGCGLITWFILRLLPADFIRVIGLTLLHALYRIRTSGTSRLPETGGVLLLPNHITWADAFFLTAACPRPVRFIMEKGFMRHRAIRMFCRIFDTLPISSSRPKDALDAATHALKAGDVVCIFPEGQLTRTGTLRELKRGFELIARRADCPLIPVWMDGVWGSVFSFEGDRFFRKLPRPLRRGLAVAFGAPLPPRGTGTGELRLGLHEASAEALRARLTLRDDPSRANALQLSQINALRRGHPIGMLDHDPQPGTLKGLRPFSDWFHAPLRALSSPSDDGPVRWMGGAALREAIRMATTTGHATEERIFFDFSERSWEPMETDGWIHCPCLAIDGIVVAMSMPDPPPPLPGSLPQSGRKPGSVGLLLPGFAVRRSKGRLHLSGPSLEREIELPDGWDLDDEGFLHPPAETPVDL